MMLGEEVRVYSALLFRLSAAMLWHTYVDIDAITRRMFVRKRVESSHCVTLSRKPRS
jgi:hypothetical protein